MTLRALTAITAAACAGRCSPRLRAPTRGRAPAQPVIRMSGQQITQAVVADLAFFYRHAVRDSPRFELTPGGTATGLADLARGITDAAMVSRNLVATDPPGGRLHRLALSGVCLATHDTNPVPAMSVSLVRDIVAGRVTSWSQVPGSTRADAILPVALDPGTGASTVFREVFLTPPTRSRGGRRRCCCRSRRATMWKPPRPRSATWTWPPRARCTRLPTTGIRAPARRSKTAATQRAGHWGSSPAASPNKTGTAAVPALDQDQPQGEQVLNRRYVAAVTG